MLTITGGNWKGRKVEVTPRLITRYTPQFARKALFDIIDVEGLRVLDLFSGSGIIAFEALSRSATNAVCIDSSRVSCNTIKKNALKLGCQEKLRILCADFRRAIPKLEKSGERFDFIFADPPFGENYIPELLEVLERNVGIFSENACLVIESSKKERELVKKYSGGAFCLYDTREYGNVFLSFLKVV
jgi:16S rRNA (guanine966-N2)-methyltransferase